MNSQNQIFIEDAKDQGPRELAHAVFRALTVSVPEPPEEWLLEVFFDALYQVSFRGEPGQPGTRRVVWQNPVNRPDAPKCSHLRLRPPVPLYAGSLASLLAAAGSHSALLVSAGEVSAADVSGREVQPLVIQPLVIQGIVPRSAGAAHSGLLGVEILGPAHLKVDVGLDYPLELRRNHLHLSALTVFERGPVRERLSALLQDVFPAVQALLPSDIAASPLLSAGSFPLPGGQVLLSEQDWPQMTELFWTRALSDLLGRVFETRLGGSVALTPRRDNLGRKENWLPPPHEAAFSQLRHLLEKRAVEAIHQQVQSVGSLSERLASQNISLDDLDFQEPPLLMETPGSDLEIAQALHFLASLSRVEGILRLDPHLDLISFGGQPSSGRLPERVYLAGDEMASEAELTPISLHSFGPRNQALLRLCYQDSDALGFAFTQDGDVRAMLWHEDKLIVWNTVSLPQ